MKTLFYYFGLITGWLYFVFFIRTKCYGNKRRIKGPCILISNHIHFYDYIVFMYIWFFRRLNCVMLDIFRPKSKLQRYLVGFVGGILVDRDKGDLSFIDTGKRVLSSGKILCFFPESHMSKTIILPFYSTYIYMALQTGAPIQIIVTAANYGFLKKNRLMIGDRIHVSDFSIPCKEKKDIDKVNTLIRRKMIINQIELKRIIHQESRLDIFNEIFYQSQMTEYPIVRFSYNDACYYGVVFNGIISYVDEKFKTIDVNSVEKIAYFSPNKRLRRKINHIDKITRVAQDMQKDNDHIDCLVSNSDFIIMCVY